MKLYTAVNVEQYAEILKTQNLPLMPLNKEQKGLSFTEDRRYWVDALQGQMDELNIKDYKYALLIEFEADGQTLNNFMLSRSTGRFSEKIIQYHQKIDKPIPVPKLQSNDKNVVAVLDIYESNETLDGISQHWLVQVESSQSDVWQIFQESVYKVSCLGGIPGAVEAAKALKK